MSRVLVVDDSRIARVVVRRALEAAGHTVVEADSAAAGLEVAPDGGFDCVTTDLLMPGIPGHDFIEKLHAKGIDAPIVVVTADIQKTTHEECLRRGAFAVIEKPLKGDELARTVAAAIGSRAKERRASLTPEQRDALTELINMGVGRAAASLNELVGGHVELNVPQVDILSLGELPSQLPELGKDRLSSVHMTFRGGLEGSAFLVFPQASAARLLSVVTGEEAGQGDLDILRSGALTEVGNILINSVIGTLSNVLERPLRYSTPVYEEEPMMDLLTKQERNDPLILLAKTTFVIRQMQIEGNLLLLFELASFDSLMSAVEAPW
jgi:chemotaxis protein CheC